MSGIGDSEICSMVMTSSSKTFALQLDCKGRSSFLQETSTLLMVSDYSGANACMPISVREKSLISKMGVPCITQESTDSSG
jgi:hypothetical protein